MGWRSFPCGPLVWWDRPLTLGLMWHRGKQGCAWSGTLYTVLDPGPGEEVALKQGDVPIQGWLTRTSVVKGADTEH